MTVPEKDLETAREKVKSSRSVVVLSGAGISSESGVPTFRGSGGLWQGRRAEELATPEAFESEPKLVWEFYDWRRSVLKEVKPNPGHFALAELEKLKKDFTLITQNVDGLHEEAGSKNILELHGNIWHLKCTVCNAKSRNTDVPISILPYCECGGLLRPDIVWFGESLDENILNKAFSKCSSCDIMFVVGTSAVVQPAASLGPLAKRGGAFVIEINPEPTPLTDAVDLAITGKSGEILPQLI
ncbi:MAG: NAD-dependent deacylase [Deltaproteobacteria bacterium]|nr:NAD-dependent deacylase [Deltaproteobacteria bacterium]